MSDEKQVTLVYKGKRKSAFGIRIGGFKGRLDPSKSNQVTVPESVANRLIRSEPDLWRLDESKSAPTYKSTDPRTEVKSKAKDDGDHA